MAKVILNSALNRVRGALGDEVYKTYRRGKRVVVVLSRRARMAGVVWSEKQKANRARMVRWGEFHRRVKLDPAMLAAYRALAATRGISISAVTQRDFFHAPTVRPLSLGDYAGRPGDTLVAYVSDDIEAHAVTFTLRTPAGEVRESGPAEMTADGVFTYVTRTAVAPGETILIEARATDRPGNTAQASRSWTADCATSPAPTLPSLAAPTAPLPGAEDFRAG